MQMNYSAAKAEFDTSHYFRWDSGTETATYDNSKCCECAFHVIFMAFNCFFILVTLGLSIGMGVAVATGGDGGFLVGVFAPLVICLIGVAMFVTGLFCFHRYILVVDFKTKLIEVTLQHPVCGCIRRKQKHTPLEFSNIRKIEFREKTSSDNDGNISTTGFVKAILQDGRNVKLFVGRPSRGRHIASVLKLIPVGGQNGKSNAQQPQAVHLQHLQQQFVQGPNVPMIMMPMQPGMQPVPTLGVMGQYQPMPVGQYQPAAAAYVPQGGAGMMMGVQQQPGVQKNASAPIQPSDIQFKMQGGQ